MKPVICYGQVDKHRIMLWEHRAHPLASVLDPPWGKTSTWGELRAAMGWYPSFAVQGVRVGTRFAPANEVALEIPAIAKTMGKHGLFVLGLMMNWELPAEIVDSGKTVSSPIYGEAVTFNFVSAYYAARAISSAGFAPREDGELIDRCLCRERRYPPKSRFAEPPSEHLLGPLKGYVCPPVPKIIEALGKVMPALQTTFSLAYLPARMRFQASLLLEEIYSHAVEIWWRCEPGGVPPVLVRRERFPDELSFDRQLCERLYPVHAAYRLVRHAADGVTYAPEPAKPFAGDWPTIMRYVREIVKAAIELYEEIDQPVSYRLAR